MFGAIMLAGVEILMMLVALSLVLLVTVFWVWMLVDAIRNKNLGDGEKIGWVLAIVFLHILGSRLYFFIGRPKSRPPMVAA